MSEPSRPRRQARAALEGPRDRPREGGAQARLDAVRAGRARDARGDRLSDRLRGLPVAAARRPALPRRQQWVGLDNYVTVLSAAMWWRDVGTRCSSPVVSVAIELVLGMLLALVDAPRDLRARAGPHRRRWSRTASSPSSPRSPGGSPGRRPRAASCRRCSAGLRPDRDHRAVLELRGRDPHRGVEDDAVHGAAAAGRADARPRASCTRRRRSTAQAPGSASGGSRSR